MIPSDLDDLPVWKRRAIGVVLLPLFLMQAIFGTLTGVLLMSIVFYLAAQTLFGVEPWRFGQLLLWFDGLPSEVKAGVLSSVITVLGFLVAMRTTMQLWQRQTAATMRIAAVESIDRVLSEVCSRLLRVQLITEAAAKEVLDVREQRRSLQDAVMLSILLEDMQEFREHRDRLLQLQQEVFNLSARYAVLFLPLAGTEKTFDKIEQQLDDVVDKIWVRCPKLGVGHPDHRQDFLERVDPLAYLELSRTCDVAGDKISGLQGGLRGTLHGPIVQLNWIALGRVLKQCFRSDVD